MKAINTGNIYNIYDDTLMTHDSLPAQVYNVRFSKGTGFYLEKKPMIEISESKVYGVCKEKVSKVLSAFDVFERSLGVILSGDKGIGKSLFAKILATTAITEKNLPLIIVDQYISGIASFIENIEQEVVILFDEFDKTFSDKVVNEGVSPQASMLSLFDGTSSGKKLFVITCNEIRGLDNFLINRPGRFHYHFRFDYPSPDEVREYLRDNLKEEYWNTIDEVVAFSRKIDLNYDCLRAIAFELNTGESFKRAIADLNIVNMNAEMYNVVLHYDNGLTAHSRDVMIDLFSDSVEDEYIYLYSDKGENFVDVSFSVSNCVFDPDNLVNIVYPENIVATYDGDPEYEQRVSEAKSANITHLTLTRKRRKGIHYAL